MSRMGSQQILALIDEELARLLQVRELLGTNGTQLVIARKKRKYTMSAEARKRIGEATRERWAARKAGAKK